MNIFLKIDEVLADAGGKPEIAEVKVAEEGVTSASFMTIPPWIAVTLLSLVSYQMLI